MAFSFGAPAAAPAMGGFNFGSTAPSVATPAAAPAPLFGAATTTAPAPAFGGFSLGGFGGAQQQQAQAQATAAVAAAQQQQQQQQVTWQTKVGDLPEQQRAHIEAFMRLIHEHSRAATEASSTQDTAHAKVGEEIARLSDRLARLAKTVATDSEAVRAIKEDVAKDTRNAEAALSAARRSKAAGWAAAAAASRMAGQYFAEVVYKAETRLEQCSQIIEELEKCIATTSATDSQQQNLAAVRQTLRNLHDLFLTVSTQAAAVHKEIARIRERVSQLQSR